MSKLDATVAKRLDITVKQNQTFNATITITDNQGDAIDLTGTSIKMSVRQESCGCNSGGCSDHAFDGFDIVLKQDFAPAITDPVNGTMEFHEVVKLSPGMYKYDLLMYTDENQVYLLTGTFKVKKSYTTAS